MVCLSVCFRSITPAKSMIRPTIALDVEEAIVDALVILCTPVGRHRNQRPQSSNDNENMTGRRAALAVVATERGSSSRRDGRNAPEVLAHLTVGYNSTMRALESLAWHGRSQSHHAAGVVHRPPSPSVSSIFVCTTTLPKVMTAPLLMLAARASTTQHERPAIRVVSVSAQSSSAIANALGQPNANVIGLSEDAPGTEQLNVLLREKVPAVDVPWLREAASAVYLPVKIHHSEVNPGSDKVDRKRKRDNASQNTHQSTNKGRKIV